MKLFEFLRPLIEGKPYIVDGEILYYTGGLSPALTDLIIASVFTVFVIIVTIILTFIIKKVLVLAVNRRVDKNKKEQEHLSKLEESNKKDRRLSDINAKFISEIKIASPYQYVDQEKRAKTIIRAAYRVIAFVIWLIALVIVLDAFSINILPIITGAGIVGIAIAFGAQEFVKDFISGLFNIFENTYSVGESIIIGDFTGTVKEIGLRTTKIEDWKGDYLIINNGQINKIINRSRDVSTAIIEVTLSNKVSIDKVVNSIKEFIKTFKSNNPDYSGAINFVGMTESNLISYTFRITSLTPPAKSPGVEREIRLALLTHLEKEGFEGPQTTVAIKA